MGKRGKTSEKGRAERGNLCWASAIRHKVRAGIITIFSLLLLETFSSSVCVAQSSTFSLPPGSPLDTIIVNQPQPSVNQVNLKQALQSSELGLEEARRNKLPIEEGQLLHQIGIINRKLRKDEESLKFLLWAVLAFERGKAPEQILKVKLDLGNHHNDSQAYQKAIEYYQEYLKGREKLGESVADATLILQKIAKGYFLLGEYEKAEENYQKLILLLKEKGELSSMIAGYEALADISKITGNTPEAIQYLEEVEQLYRQHGDTTRLIYTLNNLGFLQKRNKNLRQAIDYFQQALDFPEDYLTDQHTRISMLINMGVSYTNLGFFARAKEAYLEALEIHKASGNEVAQAEVYNYLASNAYVSKNNASALEHANQAVELAIGKNAYKELAAGYKLISLIYEEEKNEEKSHLYYQSYLDIQSRLKARETQQRQNLITIQERAEAQEEYLKASIIEQEQLTLERERQSNALKFKEKELILLKKNQALQQAELLNQQLEKERAKQQLSLANQALTTEKQKLELSELARLKELQDLRLEQQAMEQEQQKKAIALLEAESRLKEQKLNQEVVLRHYGYGLLSLFMVVIGVVSYSFVQKRKDNQKLQDQQKKIEEQNEHLRASERMLKNSVQELEVAQQALQRQKRQLEIENRKTQESLQYAKRIQFSILPSQKESQKIFPESFVIFRPKDVVSGDFYWMSDHGDRKIVSVVDCTGHGVPGALVSLIAYNMLNEAICEKKLLKPTDILSYLNQQIKRRLREGDHSIQDGMDIGICMLETRPGHSTQLSYAGAKNTLYAMQRGELVSLKGERKTVGAFLPSTILQEHVLELEPNDVLYLTTDGFIDQSNPERQRFGSRQLKSHIKEWHTLPIVEQQEKFIQVLEQHQQSSEQRDDINLIAIKI